MVLLKKLLVFLQILVFHKNTKMFAKRISIFLKSEKYKITKKQQCFLKKSENFCKYFLLK
jgi:hypothetical protein